MDKKILKFVGTKIEKYKFHQNKSLILINDIDNKIVVSNKVPFREQDFRYFTGYRDSEKLNLYAYSIHKWLHIKEILMKIDKFTFL